MQIVELHDIGDLCIDLLPQRPEGGDPIRSGGLHLTDIINDIMEVSGMQKTASGGVWAPDQLNMAAWTGFLWEDLLGMVMKDRLPCRIGEVELDGITMSPDGVEWDEEAEEMVLAEYKVRWASSNRSPADNWKWQTQIKGYCKGLGLTRVKMYILYINGDYKGGGPQFKGYLIEFTQLEVDESWEMLLNHARSKKWIK